MSALSRSSLFRFGIGQDSHQLTPARKDQTLTLAGLSFACGLITIANSDGDVIIHALCNALSTAIGGASFSLVADQLCLEKKITDSSFYLKEFLRLITEKGYFISNISISVEALQPKLEKHSSDLCRSLAKLCQIQPDQIGLAFTTGEGLTACGQGQGISALVSVLLEHV